MNKIIFSKTEADRLIAENRYRVDPEKKFFSRCIDGRYENAEGLPALAFPGADLGEILMVFAASKKFGFDIDKEKVFSTFIEVIGGEKNFGLHTDSHADPKITSGGCGHFKQILTDLATYKIDQKEVDFIKEKLELMKKKGAGEIVLHGDHMEGAVLLIKGDWGVYPQYVVDDGYNRQLTQVFIYHQSLVDERNKLFAKKLVENKAVKLVKGCDEEWLYDALFEMSEEHLMETARRLAKGLPIYAVEFKDDGGYDIKELGTV